MPPDVIVVWKPLSPRFFLKLLLLLFFLYDFHFVDGPIIITVSGIPNRGCLFVCFAEAGHQPVW